MNNLFTYKEIVNIKSIYLRSHIKYLPNILFSCRRPEILIGYSIFCRIVLCDNWIYRATK